MKAKIDELESVGLNMEEADAIVDALVALLWLDGSSGAGARESAQVVEQALDNYVDKEKI